MIILFGQMLCTILFWSGIVWSPSQSKFWVNFIFSSALQILIVLNSINSIKATSHSSNCSNDYSHGFSESFEKFSVLYTLTCYRSDLLFPLPQIFSYSKDILSRVFYLDWSSTLTLYNLRAPHQAAHLIIVCWKSLL